MSACSVEHGQDRECFLGKFLAGGCQFDAVGGWRGFQECGADVAFEVVDLTVEGSFSDAEVFGSLVEFGMSGDRKESFDALLSSAGGEDCPDQWGERVRAAVVGEDMFARGDTVADGESELARVPGQIGCRDAQLGGDVSE